MPRLLLSECLRGVRGLVQLNVASLCLPEFYIETVTLNVCILCYKNNSACLHHDGLSCQKLNKSQGNSQLQDKD